MPHRSNKHTYPEPFIVESRTAHKRSLILLHGRGSTGSKFGEEFMSKHSPSEDDIGHRLPDTRFIFPTARKRRAKWYNRATISQWFDSVPIDEQDSGMSKEQEEWQLEGLRQSRAYLKTVLDGEISAVGAANVFIGGLSQGCAMALHLLLSLETMDLASTVVLDSQRIGGFVGMSGWLPFADAIEATMRPEPTHSQSAHQDDDFEDDFEDDPFAVTSEDDCKSNSGSETGATTMARRVCDLVRDNMDLPPISEPQPAWVTPPVLLGHGKSDEKVTIDKGRRVAQCLKDLGVNVSWTEYDEGHWYKVPDQINDIISFLDGCVGEESRAHIEKRESAVP